MSKQLGNQSTGFSFSISGAFNQSQGDVYTVPSNGLMVEQLHADAATNAGTSTARLYLWRDSDGAWLIRSGTFTLTTALGFINRTDLSGSGIYPGLFVPPGVGVRFGIWVSSANYQWQAAASGTSRIGTGGDGNYVNHDNASGPGSMAAYCDYHECLHRIRRSGAWVVWPRQIRRAGVWVVPARYVRRSGAWIQVQ